MKESVYLIYLNKIYYMFNKYVFLMVAVLFWFNIESFAQTELVVVQITDPQFGFFDENRSFENETVLYTEAIRKINELKPNFVVITGDFVNNSKNVSQIDEFKRITALLDETIPVYLSPGNHDISLPPTNADLEFYFTQYGNGNDRFSIKQENTSFIGFNSVIIKSDKNCKEEEKQFKWLKRELRKARSSDNIIMFTHYPFFINDFNEKDNYSNQTIEVRNKYFELFDKFGVDAIFSGHLHNNAEASHNGILMITTNAVGRPLGEAKSGFRIIKIKKDSLEHQFVPLCN